MGKEESTSCDDTSASWDETERPSQRAWTHEDIYPTQKNGSDTSSGDESSEGEDESTEEESSEEDEDEEDSSDSSTTSFAESDPIKPKSNKSSSNYESLSEPDSSSDDDSDADAPVTSKPLPPKASGKSTSVGKPESSSADIEKALKVSKLAISEAEEQRKKQLIDIEKSGADLKAQEKKMLDISKHLDNEIQNVSSVLVNSEDNLKKLAKERVAQKSVFSVDTKTSLKQMERDARIERAKERIEQEREEKEKKERDEKSAKIASSHDSSEKARIERAYTWYTRMAMPSREKMKERIAVMSSTTGVSAEDVDLLPWNARGTFVSVATMMKIQRTSSSAVGRKK